MKYLYLFVVLLILSSCGSSKSILKTKHKKETETLASEIRSLKKENKELSNQVNELEGKNNELSTQINSQNNKVTSQNSKETSKFALSITSGLSNLEKQFSSSSKFSKFKNGGMEKTLNVSQAQMEKVIRSSKGFLGTPHVMGGLSKNGIDCSGLLYQSFKINNVNNIPRTAQDFARYGTIILDLNNLKRGDLVFFTNTYSTSKFITHAGICLGNGEFIHTSSSKGVIISKLNDPYYWKKKFVYGTRIL